MSGHDPSYSNFRSAAARSGISVSLDEPLARHTTYRIGGPADLYVMASDPAALQRLADLAAEHDIPVVVLGGGSNILVSDAGIRGLVIANGYRDMRLRGDEESEGKTGQLVAGSGAPLAGLARWAMRAGLSGIEWAVSIPGTVGGAVVGNAGAHGGDIASNLAWVLVANPGKGQQLLHPDELGLAYRSSIFKRRLLAREAAPVLLEAGFNLVPGDPEVMNGVAESYLARRRATQPVEPSAGSVFRNPPDDHAGRLIETVGLKGHCIGAAQISLKHANFIINRGGASAADVRELINLAQARVFEQFGIMLMPEILFIGDWHCETEEYDT